MLTTGMGRWTCRVLGFRVGFGIDLEPEGRFA
jgi:hypothetical protein